MPRFTITTNLSADRNTTIRGSVKDLLEILHSKEDSLLMYVEITMKNPDDTTTRLNLHTSIREGDRYSRLVANVDPLAHEHED